MQKQQIVIFDTTLRDGEQAPGAKMDVNQKILIAKNLESLGIDVIEAGFASSSQGEFEVFMRLSEILTTSTLCSLARAKKEDITLASEAMQNSKNKRLHTFLSTSDIHIKHKLNKTHEQVLEMIKKSVSYAKELFQDVEWSAEDATRTNFDFLCNCVEIAIKSGAKTINLPDTVGYMYPSEYGEMIAKIVKFVNDDNVIISTHCHDDLGMATANSLSAVKNGARQVECTINGIGERAGNCALEEIVMAIKTRSDILPFQTNIDTTKFIKISELVENITGIFVQSNKAIIGKNAFSHESGVHQDGMLKNKQTYEIINPIDIGRDATTISLGKLSGRNALNDKLIKLGFNLSKDELDLIFTKFKNLCDAKKVIYDSDIISLVSDVASENIDGVSKYEVQSFEDGKSVVISGFYDGKDFEIKNQSFSILDAGFRGINNFFNINPSLEKYEIKAVTLDTDAQGMANIILKIDEKYTNCTSHACDVVLASLKAYFGACMKFFS